MVARSALCTAIFIFPTLAQAKSPMEQMFPGPESCYARNYTGAELAEHPAQLVTDIAIRPDFSTDDPLLTVQLSLTLRKVPGGAFEATAYCENSGEDALSCGIEGDAGGFQINSAKDGAILISVSNQGMTLENDRSFATLERKAGDDRSFLLAPVACR
jgi:hypothetical protein